MSIRRDPTETEPIIKSSTPSTSSVSNIPSQSHSAVTTDSTLLQRINHHFNYHKHGLSALFLGSIVLFLVLIFGLATFLPVVHSRRSFYGYIQPPVSPGLSIHSFQQGLSKCQSIKKSIIDSTNEERLINPRAPNDIPPILLKNAVVWDGEGEILNNVDILMMNGVISQVKQDIQEPPKGAKIIDVGGHIVSPGLVDMHT